MKKLTRLPDTELEVMKVVWQKGNGVSTSEIKQELDKQRTWNVSALQTLLNRLIDRGFLTSYKKGKNKLYDIVVEQESYLTFENSSFLKKVNENSVTKLVASLYHSRCISKKDLQELAEFIEKSAEGDENV
ncbi:MAG: BlaI/MecI/CopY family transcriptional regulator [Firmicutes bacterium]|jgi:predicted transcriptional regulator|nr:BlaI/MecI/CopY family transcriptional regulator [Bacillota bacterium]